MPDSPHLLLLPRPRRLVRPGGWLRLAPDAPLLIHGFDAAEAAATLGRRVLAAPRADAHIRCDASAAGAGSGASESYSLEIDPSTIGIAAATREGHRLALRTLSQVLRQSAHALPCLRIEDEPAFRVRGVMLDVSRDRVPTMEHLLRTVDLLCSLKFNHLQLYTEHTFAYAGHEDIWRGWSPLTPAEVREIDAYCRVRGVTLAANQNCFGHLAQWLRHPRYAPLAETHGEWTFMEWPRSGPFSLCPIDPGAIALVDDLLGQLLPCFTSGLANIGCDETYDVGQGRSREIVAQRGRAAVYFDFVREVYERVRSRGFRPMFWADIALSHPEAIDRIPEDMISLAWGYEPDSPFAEWCARLHGARRECWVCPGSSSWRSITGRTAERRANLHAAAAQGLANGATGYLVTDWGDSGHHQHWPIALHALAEAADAAWTGGSLGPFDPAASSLHAFADTTLAIGPWLDELGDADAGLRRRAGVPASDGSPRPLRNASALFNDLHGHPSGDPRVPDPADWRHVLEVLDNLAARRPSGLAALERDELSHTLAVARLAAEHAAMRREPGGPSPVDRRRLTATMDGIIDEHRRLWPARSRPGGLDHSCEFYAKARRRIAQGGSLTR